MECRSCEQVHSSDFFCAENEEKSWPADIAILSLPDRLVRALLEVIEPRRKHSAICTPVAPLAKAPAESVVEGRISIEALARTAVAHLAPHNPSFLRLPIGWPGEYCRFAHPLDYIGYDGGGGIGSGPGMAVGAALALRHSDRLPVAH